MIYINLTKPVKLLRKLRGGVGEVIRKVTNSLKSLFKRFKIKKLKQARKTLLFVSLALVLSIGLNIGIGVYHAGVVDQKQIEIEERQTRLDELNSSIVELEKKLEENQITQQEYEEQIQQLNNEKDELNQKLQAKLEAQQKAKQQASTAYASSSYQVSGDCATWMAQAGVTDTANAYTLIMRESGCSVNAVNKSSGACGIPQALPCSKLGSARGNPVAEIQWMQNYVFSRYGSWANAVAFWNSHHWY